MLKLSNIKKRKRRITVLELHCCTGLLIPTSFSNFIQDLKNYDWEYGISGLYFIDLCF